MKASVFNEEQIICILRERERPTCAASTALAAQRFTSGRQSTGHGGALASGHTEGLGKPTADHLRQTQRLRCATGRGAVPVPLHHQATQAQMRNGLYPSLGES